uniref:IncA protein n=1 Tax=Strongyloides venezuelensis TaxID=75913 RepID=A0A0K0F2E4_STRVS
MSMYLKTRSFSIAVFLIIFGISLFVILGILGVIFFINYGINDMTAWIVMVLGIISFLISILFSTRIQLLESYKNKKMRERIHKREQQRRNERRRAKEMINQKEIFYVKIHERLKNNDSSPPCYDDVIKYT